MPVADKHHHNLSKKGNPTRWTGRLQTGYFPLSVSEAQWIRKFLLFPDKSPGLDPCVGDRSAFAAITSGAEAILRGIELDSYRAEQAKQRIAHVIQGDTIEVHFEPLLDMPRRDTVTGQQRRLMARGGQSHLAVRNLQLGPPHYYMCGRRPGFSICAFSFARAALDLPGVGRNRY
jgi:hypothetical protein